MSGRERVWDGAMWPTRIRRSGVVPVPARIASIPAGITAEESRIENSGSENGCGRIWDVVRCWTTTPAGADFPPRDARISDRFRPHPVNPMSRRCPSPRLRRLHSEIQIGHTATPFPVDPLVRPVFLCGRLTDLHCGRWVGFHRYDSSINPRFSAVSEEMLDARCISH